MKYKNHIFIVFCTAIFLICIFNASTTVSGAAEGVTLCLKAVIPSLFPFMIISNLLCSRIVNFSFPWLKPVSGALGIPAGTESIVAVGYLSGYPIGAQNLVQAWQSGVITKEDAYRMLAFCNNAGPAFILGMLSGIFNRSYIPFIIWIIHISSSLCVAMMLPKGKHHSATPVRSASLSITTALNNAIRSMGIVCGWVIVFRVLIKLCQTLLLWAIPTDMAIVAGGILELTNGIIDLNMLSSPGDQFILASTLVSWGGLCVLFQTYSVTKPLGLGLYFPGKVLQTLISFVISYIIQIFVFPATEQSKLPWILWFGALLGIGACIIFFYFQKGMEINRNIVYNKKKAKKKGDIFHAVSQEASPFL